MLEITKTITCFILILIFYYFVNFEFFYFNELYEMDYYICLVLGLLPYFIFKYIRDITEDSLYESPAKFTLLMTAIWYVSYGILVEEVILKSYTLALLLIGGASLSILTNNHWPYKTDDGMLFKLKHNRYCKLIEGLSLALILLIVYVLYIGEWGV